MRRHAEDPRVSIVVTCHDYGHFLESCLESVLAQTLAPFEVIVVDDGSTDASGAILARYAGQVRAIRTPNRGQAAAFNTGFRASSGDVVLFLDADDRLNGDAVEAIVRCWSEDLAVLAFGLETVDAAGRGTGVYRPSVDVDTGDNRPLLLATGTFRFPPTSGNAFSRRALAAALPMPEERWVISADCYLIRAAALVGRFDSIPQILGAYRLHGTNAYASGTAEAVSPRQHAANLRDIADALEGLADAATAFATGPAEADALALALRGRASALLAETRRDGGRGPQPWWGRSAAPGAAAARGCDGDALERLAVPRHPVHLPPDRWIRLDDRSPRRGAVLPATTPGECRLFFTVDPAAHPRAVSLRIRLDPPDAVDLAGEIDGETAWSGSVEDGGTVDLPLAPAPLSIRRAVSVRLAARDSRPWQRGVAVGAVEVRVGAPDAAAAHPHLEAGAPVSPAPRLANGFAADEWTMEDGGAARLRGASGAVRIAVPDHAGACDLLLALASPLPAGWLTLRAGGATLFAGALGASHEIAVRLPERGPGGRLALALDFEPGGGEEEPLRIAALALRRVPRVEGESRSLAAPLNAGEIVNFGVAYNRSRFLGKGWSACEEEDVVNARAEAVIRFRTPDATDLVAVLAIAPVLPPQEDVRHIVGVSTGGEMVQAVELGGAAQVEVPLPDLPDREVALTVHSTLVFGDGSDRPGPLGLRSLALRGRGRLPEPPRAVPLPPPAFGLERIAEAVRRHGAARARGGMAAFAEEAPALRAEFTALLATASAKACLLVATLPGALALLDTVREAAATRPATTAEREALALAAARARGTDALERSRAALIEIMHHPPEAATDLGDLSRLPPPLLFDRRALAGYLAAVPHVRDAAEHARARAFATELLSSIDRILAAEPVDGALFDLAEQTLERLRTTGLIFGEGVMRDLVRLRSRCIERLLVRKGMRLSMPLPPRRVDGPLRLGVLVRDVAANPEGFALLGMYDGLDRDRFEPLLIRMDRGADALDVSGIFREELCLAGLGVEAAVAAIRALDLDLFVQGAYVADYEKTSAVSAHRLAPVQVWPGAVCPTTGGFLSFDVALTCRATEPEAPERHYVEPLAWIEGPKQAAYAFPEIDLPPAKAVRAEIGVPDGATMLTSGAMAHKIQDALLAAWAKILAGAPEAVLVLYPFATNWSMRFVHDAFRARLDRHCAAAGVAPERIVCLWTQPPGRVRAIAAAADLYLDSFPYTGATTVCEALSCGTPVLTRAGDALRQLTGASWVRAFDLPELVARSPEEYVATALRFCDDGQWRERLRARLSATLTAGPPPHHDVAGFGRAFSDALLRIARRSGRFPGLAQAPSASRARPRPVGPADVVSATMRRPSRAARAGAPAARVALLASPRTGSTLLCNLLNRTPGILCHYELFHEAMIQFVDRTVEDEDAIAARDADPVGFLRTVFEDAERDGFAAIGFKHFDFLNDAVTRALVADPTIRIVHLTRRNLLAQYSSEMIAQRDADWFRGNAAAGESREPRRIVFDEAAFEEWEAYQRRVLARRADLFAEYGRAPLFLDYAALRDPGVVEPISRFLGVRLAADGELRSQMHNRPRIIDRFANPADVLAYLRRRERQEWAGYG